MNYFTISKKLNFDYDYHYYIYHHHHYPNYYHPNHNRHNHQDNSFDHIGYLITLQLLLYANSIN